jgi:multidrug efflux pump subunit AcrA (membrane-fusion protein)
MSEAVSKPRRKRRRLRPWVIAVIVVAAVVVAYVLLLSPISLLGRASRNPIQGSTTVETRTVNETVQVTGNIEPVQTQTLQFFVPGQLSYLGVEQGQKVSKGTLVAALSDTEAQYQLKSIENNIENARLTGSTSQLALLQLQRQAQLETIAQMRIVSTLNGVVGTLTSELAVGDYLEAGQSFGALIDVSSLQAVVEVDELDVPKVAVGQPVDFHFDALPNLKVAGTVTSIPPQGTVNSQGIAVVDMTLTIPNPPPGLVPSFSFNADIVYRQNEQILVISSDAVITQNGKTYALVEVPGEQPRLTPIAVVPYQAGLDQVLSGLSAGEKVLVLKPSARAAPQSSGLFFGGRAGGGGRPPSGGGPSSSGGARSSSSAGPSSSATVPAAP